MLLYELQWWDKVAVRTDKDDGVCSVKHTIGYHADRDVHIGLFLLRAGNGVMAVGTLNLFVEVLATHYLKAVAVQELVSVEECTLSAALLGLRGDAVK